ncbi:hypothetical protein [Flaviflexus massiliensis]|uniref:hypothetical protein n=1 Tax=Flaviflexus massiliensis TaxID=1522309 RepID=UPI001E5CE5A2|nr:hypothetical protein [Flaviflexus massiliensis]
MADELFATVRAKNLGLVVVTHDPTIAKRADRTIDLGSYAPNGGTESTPPAEKRKRRLLRMR